MRSIGKNRWLLTGTQTSFTEPDERKAIAKFHSLKLQAVGDPIVQMRLPKQVRERYEKFLTEVARLDDTDPVWQTVVNHKVEIDEMELWAWMRESILTKPELCAKMTGIEQLGWLDKVAKPVDYALAGIGQFYFDHSNCCYKEKIASATYWRYFTEKMGSMLSDVTRERVMAFESGQTNNRGAESISIRSTPK